MNDTHYPDLLIHNIGELVTLASTGGGPRCGREMNIIGLVPNGAVAVAAGRILAAGSEKEVTTRFKPGPETWQIDAEGRLVSPGLVDAHTHLIFAGSRENEFHLKITKGLSYEQIEGLGGGVPASVRHTRAADMETLLAQANEKAMDTAAITIPAGPRLGNLVIQAEHVNKGFGDRLLIEIHCYLIGI